MLCSDVAQKASPVLSILFGRLVSAAQVVVAASFVAAVVVVALDMAAVAVN